MNLLFPILGVAALGLASAPFLCDCDCLGADDGPAADQMTSRAVLEPVGSYLEARNVTLWGGHCHLNSEYDHQGDAAIVAWSIEHGAFDGVELAGVDVVAAIASEENLAEGEGRSSELFVDAPTDEQRRAAEAWLRATHAAELGTIASVSSRAIALDRDGDDFRLAVDGLADLAGSALADRSCCTMQEMRGYEPMMAEAGAIVGYADTCAFEGTPALDGWEYAGANSVFLTRFGQVQTLEAVCACDAAGCTTDELPRP